MSSRELDFTKLGRGAMEGVFGRYEIPAVLMRVVREGRTGRLTITDGTKVRTVGFAGGLPTLAGSQVPSEHFGQRLAKLNLITPDDLARVDSLMVREPIQFGAAMVKLGIASTSELRRLLTTHHSWIIAQCLNATEVKVAFAPFVWVAKDPSALALLQAVEDGVRAYGRGEIHELWAEAERWRFMTSDEDIALARRLGCPRPVSDLLDRSRGAWRTAVQLATACEDSDPHVVVLSLALAGLWRAEVAPGAASAGLPSSQAAGSTPATPGSGDASWAAGTSTSGQGASPWPASGQGAAPWGASGAPAQGATPWTPGGTSAPDGAARAASAPWSAGGPWATGGATSPSGPAWGAPAGAQPASPSSSNADGAPATSGLGSAQASFGPTSSPAPSAPAARGAGPASAAALATGAGAGDGQWWETTPPVPTDGAGPRGGPAGAPSRGKSIPAAETHYRPQPATVVLTAAKLERSARRVTLDFGRAIIGHRFFRSKLGMLTVALVSGVVVGAVVIATRPHAGVPSASVQAGALDATEPALLGAPPVHHGVQAAALGGGHNETAASPGVGPADSTAVAKLAARTSAVTATEPGADVAADAGSGAAAQSDAVRAQPPTDATRAAPDAAAAAPLAPADAAKAAELAAKAAAEKHARAKQQPVAHAAAPAAEPARAAAPAGRPEVEQGLQDCKQAAQGGDFRRAVAACQGVLATDPRNPLAYRVLGVAYTKLAAKPQACESFRRYLRFAPAAPDRAQIEAWLHACD